MQDENNLFFLLEKGMQAILEEFCQLFSKLLTNRTKEGEQGHVPVVYRCDNCGYTHFEILGMKRENREDGIPGYTLTANLYCYNCRECIFVMIQSALFRPYISKEQNFEYLPDERHIHDHSTSEN